MALRPTRISKTQTALIALGGVSIAALLWMFSGNDAPPPAPVASPPVPATPVKPYNPDAGKYMPLVLYADAKQYPYPALTGSQSRSEERAKAACLKSAYAGACRPVAILTSEEPGCIAYARDTKDGEKYHMNIFHRVEDNLPFAGGAPAVPRYFCNDPVLERQLQDGVKISPPKVTIDRTEVYTDKILVLTRDVYLANEHGQYRGGPMIVEGSCVEFHPGAVGNTGITAIAHLVTAWEKNGNGNNRSGYVEHEYTRSAIVGEYTPATCFAVFGPKAP
jgi:hypothetical protein